MLKKWLTILTIVALFSACNGPERDCNAFKTGTFSFEYEIDNVKKQGTFVRSETHSVDYYDNKIDSATVRWINNCEFVLQPLNGTAAIHYKILSTTKESYTFEYQRAVRDPNRKLVVKKGIATKN